MLQKPLLARLSVVVWVLFCGVFLGVAETIVGSPVCCCVGIVLWNVSWCCRNHCWFACFVVRVLFCGVFLSVVETIVGWPVCCCVCIVLWSFSWCCRNHCWFTCGLLCGYCFVEFFLVLQKPLLVGLCVVVLVLFGGVFLGVAETIVGSPVLLVGIVLWNVSWCCRNHCWFTCVVGGYCFVECFLVLQKPLLVRLCCCAAIVLWSVS